MSVATADLTAALAATKAALEASPAPVHVVVSDALFATFHAHFDRGAAVVVVDTGFTAPSRWSRMPSRLIVYASDHADILVPRSLADAAAATAGNAARGP
jgi:hypothetical protein